MTILGRLSGHSLALATMGLGCLYLALMNGHNQSIDGLMMYRQALSLVQHHSLALDPPVIWGGGVSTTSKYGIGLSLLFLPGVGAALAAGLRPPPMAGPYDWDLFYRDPVFAAGAAPVFAVVTALSAYAVGALVMELGHGRRAALAALAAFGIGSPALVYSRGDFSQPVMALCMAAGLLAAVRYRRTGESPWLALAAGSVAYGVLTRPVEGTLLLPALAVVAYSRNRWRAVSILGAGWLAGIAITAVVEWGRFGSPFATGYGQEGWSTQPWIGIPGTLASPARGVIWQFPLVLLAPLGVWRLWRGRQRGLAAAMTGLVCFLLLNAALWNPWWGAWSWGSRLFQPAWPAVAVLAVVGASSLRPALRWWLPIALGLWGVLWALPGALTDLLAGYGGAYSGSDLSFKLSAYPPLGAWRFVDHWRPAGMLDNRGVDSIWLRLAGQFHHRWLLAVPVALVVAAALLAWLAVRGPMAIERARIDASPASRPAQASP